jgi:hypothetical protein
MHPPERDIQAVRVAGSVLLGVGLIQLLLTMFVALFGLFSGLSSGTANFAKGLLAVALSLTMASIMSSCAIQMQNLRSYTQSQIQTVRIVWTSLVLVMVLCGLAGLWVLPTLTTLAVLVILILFTIRRPIIRLSSDR